MNEITNVPELFGCDVFNEFTMKKCLSDDIFQAWKNCVSTGSQLQLDVADKIAEAIVVAARKDYGGNDRVAYLCLPGDEQIL